MAIRKIVQAGDDVLRKKCFLVTDFGKKTAELLDDMRDTLLKANGVGLAAPQVGVLRRIFVIDMENEGFFEFINPEIIEEKGEQYGTEGCLSIVGKWGDVKRPETVTVKYYDREGKEFKKTVSGLFARAVCHENDHLNGILYIDKADNIRAETEDK